MRAAKNCDLAALSCLQRLGVPFGEASWWREAKEVKVPLAACRWMVERGAPWDAEEAKKLVRWGMQDDRELLAWVEERMS